jgi:hypothetical protein
MEGDNVQNPLPRVCLTVATPSDNMVCKVKSWLSQMIRQARTGSELSARLQGFKHIGPVIARIFTREIAPIWYGSSKSLQRVAELKRLTRKTGA